MRKIFVVTLVLWIGCIASGVLRSEKPIAQQSPTFCSTTELRSKADDVLSRTDVSVRGEIGVVFDLVDRLLAENQSETAEAYLVQGLAHYPWNLKYQMVHAELLAAKGDRPASEEKARLVLEHAEDTDLIAKAMKLLGQESQPAIPDIGIIPGTDACVVLVPLQGCAEWLLVRVQKDLSEVLALPVHIQKIKMEYPASSRDQRGCLLNLARREILKNIDDAEIKTAMIRLGITKDDLNVDGSLIKLLDFILKKSGSRAVEQFHSTLNDGIGKNPQWDAMELQAALFNAIRPYYRKNVVYLGITPVDIYTGNYNFLFAKGLVISYHRLTAEFNEETPNQSRLTKRVLTQCLASSADFYQVPRCTNPTCAHAYPNSLKEHDAKNSTLCSVCRAGLPKVTGDIGKQRNQ